MEKFRKFFNGFQYDLKAFLFWCLVFSVLRICFITLYSGQLQDTSAADIASSIFLGLRLSLKTCGIIMLLDVVIATIPGAVLANYPANAVRKIWHGAAAVFFSICFFARIPYYKIFNSAFNMMLVNGMYDDKAAILDTAINEYQLLWRLPCAIFFGLFIIWLLTYLWKHTAIVDFTDIKRKN